MQQVVAKYFERLEENHTCNDFHTNVDCFVMMVVRTDYFSLTFFHITPRTVAAREARYRFGGFID
jgi:hypothetical protein